MTVNCPPTDQIGPAMTQVAATEAARLSALLFKARESIEMFADIVETRMQRADTYNRGLVAEIDQYRADRGWSPNGFGGEL